MRDADAGKIERDTSEPADTFESPDVVDIVEVPEVDYLTCVRNGGRGGNAGANGVAVNF